MIFPSEDAVVRFDTDAAHVHLEFAGDDFRDLVHDPDIVEAGEPHAGEEGDLLLVRPLRLHNAVSIVRHQPDRVRATYAVDLDAFVHGNEAEHVVARNRIATRLARYRCVRGSRRSWLSLEPRTFLTSCSSETGASCLAGVRALIPPFFDGEFFSGPGTSMMPSRPGKTIRGWWGFW